ncbi:MAG: MFS transporter [Trebonia sp.]
MRTYRELFAVAEFRALFIAQCLAMAAASAGSLALGTVTYAATGNAVLTGLSMFGGPLIRLAASWFTSSAADLLRPRQALMAVAAVTGAADLLQALPGLAWGARFAFLALPWIAMAATSGSMLALVSDILPADSFVFGRATLNVAVGGMQVAGYGLGGLLLVALTTSGLFLAAAGAAVVAVFVVYRGVGDHPPRVTGQRLVRRSRAVNRVLLGSPLLRPVLLAGCVPNGLVVGCESLFIPFGAHAAGYLLAVTAAGMLCGDVLVGRVLPAAARTWLVEPLRFLLAAPYVLFLFRPPLPVALTLGFLASAGYAASLPLQERLLTHTAADVRGQVLGLYSTGTMAMQGVAALLAGLLAQRLGGGQAAAATAIGILGCASLTVTVTLIPGLRRTRPPVGAGRRSGGRVPEKSVAAGGAVSS